MWVLKPVIIPNTDSPETSSHQLPMSSSSDWYLNSCADPKKVLFHGYTDCFLGSYTDSLKSHCNDRDMSSVLVNSVKINHPQHELNQWLHIMYTHTLTTAPQRHLFIVKLIQLYCIISFNSAVTCHGALQNAEMSWLSQQFSWCAKFIW